LPPTPPFTPTPEQIQQVEERYLQLAQPEFDGIRTQIAGELNIPKNAVKKIVKELRDRQNIPSWWDLRSYAGTAEDMEKIKAIYDPYLPVPFVGVHKKIADELSLKEGVVYQAIKKIRQDMGLPQYNDPAFHAEEFAQIAKERQAAKERREAEKQARLAAQSAQFAEVTVAFSAEVVAAVP
jgi:biotin operon repressor